MKENITSTFISELIPKLSPNEATNLACDTQKIPRVSIAPKPRWTRVVRVNKEPTVDVSYGKPSNRKRIVAFSDDHSKLPNKCYQVSRSEEDAGIELVEAYT